MITREEVGLALGELRPLLQADGADLEIASVDEEIGEVTLRLNLQDVSCLECVVPPELLQVVVSDAVQKYSPGVSSVVIHDPRQGAP